MAISSLQEEQNTYDQYLSQWILEGRTDLFVLIKGTNIEGFYKSSSEAFSIGIENFGLNQFFMTRIMPLDSINITFMGKAI